MRIIVPLIITDWDCETSMVLKSGSPETECKFDDKKIQAYQAKQDNWYRYTQEFVQEVHQ